jgi:Arc/MetJ-type ribon-helix-helix transcriptional regulator
MSKITFRADDDLIDRLEDFEASKSEVMRDALRAYLDDSQSSGPSPERSSAATEADPDSIDGLIEDRVDAIITERVDTIMADRLDTATAPTQPRDVNVNISLDNESGAVTDDRSSSAQPSDTATGGDPAGVSHDHDGRKTAGESGETDGPRPQSACAQCGENLSSAHVYCPNCGEKASRRVFCDCGDELRSDWGFCPGCGRRTPAADVLEQSRTGANRE